MGTVRRKRAFTLIELLIVVAIIAILAMIAVPNFLKAQTRAKVSRVKSDLRTLATAEETYFTDWNSYTKYDRGDSWGPGGEIVYEGWKQLTTPVPYTASIPIDPFGTSQDAPTGRPSPPLYELGTGEAGVGPGAPNTGARLMVRATDTYQMNSNGPDRWDDTIARGHTYSWTEWNYPWEDLNANDPAKVVEALSLIYDPTNGTVSAGDVFRFGGVKPAGAVFDLLFAFTGR
jgi:prepilin-type N-terminal cleavage/methylation domain-containing protein